MYLLWILKRIQIFKKEFIINYWFYGASIVSSLEKIQYMMLFVWSFKLYYKCK